LKSGNAVLNEIHKETSVEAVEKLMDDTAEAIAYQNVMINQIYFLGMLIQL
jgi:charged multivesicular body protein 6